MFSFLINYKGYFFWLLVVSILCFGLERLFTWRRSQKPFRQQLLQDVGFLFINGHYFGILLVVFSKPLVEFIGHHFQAVGLPHPKEIGLLSHMPWGAQFVILWIFRDFLEWCVHNLLHRVSFLWRFHKVHHSIKEMDFIGNFRFHWMETIIYGGLTWFPLIVLGVDRDILLPLAIITTFIGHLNHANIPWSYGPLKYIFNSPKMHIWHHDVEMHQKNGQNFGITLSIFDWIFKTAYWPKDTEQPQQIGFHGDQDFPQSLIGRMLYPLSLLWNKRPVSRFLK